jgi:DNA-binding CsgD family transcriptional regulator
LIARAALWWRGGMELFRTLGTPFFVRDSVARKGWGEPERRRPQPADTPSWLAAGGDSCGELRGKASPSPGGESGRPWLYRRLERRAAGFADGAGRELQAAGERLRQRRADAREKLTPRQLQVARLPRHRRTNSEIAADLFLGPRTVEWHPVRARQARGPLPHPAPPRRAEPPSAETTSA